MNAVVGSQSIPSTYIQISFTSQLHHFISRYNKFEYAVLIIIIIIIIV